MKPYEIQVEQCLVFGDVHEDLTYVKTAMDKERGNYDHIVFLGDEFDPKNENAVGAKQTAKFIIEVQEGIYGPATQLLGNHPQQYMESWAANQRFSRHKDPLYTCGGFSNNRSIDINKILSWENWMKFQLFCNFGGYTLSHAGISEGLWNKALGREENLDALYTESRLALQNIAHSPSSRLLVAGQSRGGFHPIPGLTWCDFTDDFHDSIFIGPQICGHTRDKTVRFKGESWCLDAGQTAYALLNNSGKLTLKSIDGEPKIEEGRNW